MTGVAGWDSASNRASIEPVMALLLEARRRGLASRGGVHDTGIAGKLARNLSNDGAGAAHVQFQSKARASCRVGDARHA